MEDRVRPPGRRLIELAINDAIQSRLCLNSPIKAQMEKEKKERRRNISKITVWTENRCQSASVDSGVPARESLRESRTNSLESTWNYQLTRNSHSVKNQNAHLPSIRPAFSDQHKNEFFNRCTKVYDTPSVSLNSSKLRSRDIPYCSTTPTVITTSAENCCNEQSNAAHKPNDVHGCQKNSQQIYPSYNCLDNRTVNIQSDPKTNLSTDYDLPILLDPSRSDWFKMSSSAPEFSPNEKSNILKPSSDLLNHLTLHSLENTLKYPSEESLNEFIQPPKSGSHWLNVGEQNVLNTSEVEVPAPLNLVDDSYSLPIKPPKEQVLNFYESSTYNDNMRVQRSPSPVNDDTNHLENHSTVEDYHSKSNPHYSTLRHFEDLMLDHPKLYSPLVTITTDNLELKIVSSNAQFDDYDIDYPVLKTNGVNPDYLSNNLNGTIPFDNLHSIKADNIFKHEVGKNSNSILEYNHVKNDVGKLIGNFPYIDFKNNIQQNYLNYNASQLNPKIDVSNSNPYRTNLSNKDKLNYPGTLAFEQLPTMIYSDTGKSETSNQNFNSEVPNSLKLRDSSLNPDVFICPTSGNLQVAHFFNSNSGHDETNVLNSSYCCIKNSKHGSSVEMFNSTNLTNNSFCSDFYNHSISDNNKASKSQSLRTVSNSLDSGIELTSEDWEYDSTWNLRTPSKSLNVSSSIQDEMDKSNNSETIANKCETGNLSKSQIAKDILSTTKLKFSLIPFNEYESARIEALIDKFKDK